MAVSTVANPRLIDPIAQFPYYSLDEVGFAFSIGGCLPAIRKRRASTGTSLDASIPIVDGGQPRRRLIDVTVTGNKKENGNEWVSNVRRDRGSKKKKQKNDIGGDAFRRFSQPIPSRFFLINLGYDPFSLAAYIG